MSPKKPQEIPNAGADGLMVVNEATGEIHVRDFDSEGVSVLLLEHDLHQLNVLNLFSKINQARNYIDNPRFTAKHRDPEASREGAARNRDALKRTAMMEFGRSVGLFALADSGLVEDVEPYKQETRARWEIFREDFAEPAKAVEREAYAKWLKDDIKELQTNRTKYNRTHGLRPHAPDDEQVQRWLPTFAHEPVVIEKLTTQQRLEALAGDPRAGFLPATHLEKNHALQFLDYLDNPAYPLGINNQYFEVFIHQQKLPDGAGSLEIAEAATISITHELVDHYMSATESLERLKELDLATTGLKPSLWATDVLGVGDPVFRVLIRYRDGTRLRDKNQLPHGIKDPLTTKKDRQPHFDRTKNKTIEDVYTRRKRGADVDSYVATETAGWTIKDIRRQIAAVSTNEQLRKKFWCERMLEFRAMSDSRYMPMWQIVEPILREYESVA
jgi:hypothetical protein